MRTTIILASVLFSACGNTPCGTGTIERNGACVSADVTTSTAECGPETMLVGNQCVSTTVCDPDTTMPVVDPSTGMTTCKGTAGGGCGTCPMTPTSGKQNICGQIYDFETNMPYVATGASGTRCTTGATDGPCALAILPYDAIAFAMNPATATPLAVDDVCIDDMGRYYLKNVTEPAGPFMGLGLDDPANQGPGGITNTVGVALKKEPDKATTGFEHWIVKPETTAAWASSGGPSISTGYYVPVFRAHCVDTANSGPGCSGDPFVNETGVQFRRNMTVEPPANAFYFQAAQTTRHDVDTSATVTGVNGTALINDASLSFSGLPYDGTGGLTDTTDCKWDTKAGQTLPGVVFIQLFRPINVFGKTCTE